jgi:Xaa-Pro aminopeptidase
MNEKKKRFGKLRQLNDKIDAFAVFNFSSNFTDPNFFYLTNSSVNGILFYDFKEAEIITSSMEYTRAKKSWIKKIEKTKIKDFFDSIKGKKIGIDKENISAQVFLKLSRKCNLIDISENLQRARIIKTAYEINCIRKACNISKKIYKKIEAQVSTDLTERELKKIIDIEILKNGVEPSFSTITASGSNVKHPHHVATNKKLTNPVLIDFGVRYNGYCSDVTRTTGSKYETILEKILEDIYDTVKPGISASQLDKLTRSKMGKNSKYFITSLGHGIGLEIHERPWISTNSNDVLKSGMAFTIEPGIYKNGGLRIENDFILKENGMEFLTKF